VRCTWELTVGHGADRDGLVLPDGCQDIVLLAGGLLVAGPDTGPAPVTRVAGETVAGVRFHPGAAPPLLGPAASELLDTRVPLDGVWGRRGRELEERAAGAASPAAGLAVVEAALVAAAGDPATRPSLALAAAEAGYADQAHMSAECVRLAGLTPSTLLHRQR